MTGAQQNASVVTTLAGGVGRSSLASIQTGLAPRPFRRSEPERRIRTWQIVRRVAGIASSESPSDRAICLSALRWIPG